MKKAFLLTWLAAGWLFVSAQTDLSLVQKWSFDSYGDDLGLAGLVVSDLDKNGRPEVIMSSTKTDYSFTTGAPPVRGLFSVVEFNPLTNRYEPKWTSRTFPYKITEIQVHDLSGDGIDEIFIGFLNGEIKVLNSTNFKELYSFFTTRSTPYDNFPVTSIAFGDIDNDGTKNIVATNGNLTYIFSTSFQLLRTINLAGGKIILGNVDQDAAVESIYAGGQIIQYSVSGQVNDFKFYPANHYETVVRLADMNLDGVQDVIYSSRDSVHMVDVKTQTRVRSIKKSQTSGYISDFQVYDQTLDGIPDLFVANDGGQQDVHAYDGATGAFNYTIHEFPSSSVKSLAVAPLDDEPGAELFLIIRSNFLVYDLDTHAKTWKNIYRQGDIRAFDAGNIGGTGGDELVIGSFDDVRGSLERRKMSDKSVIAEIYDPFFTGMGLESYSALKIGDVDDDGIDEIVLGIESGHRSETRAYILDKNFNVLRYYEVDGMSLISDIAIEDVDNDGQNEIILTCGTNVTGSTDPAEWQNFIYILDGATGSIEWQSQKIGIVGSRIGNIRIGNVDNDPALEILALRFENEILPSPPPVLYIIDAATHNVIMNMNHVYTSFDIYDTDNDGIKDIVAGTKGGSILALDGETLAVKATIASGKGKISSLIGFDVNADGNKEIVYTNSYRLIVYDPASSSTIAHSDTLDNQTGRFASLRIFGNSMEEAKIFVTTNNALHEFRITPKVNSKPAGFNLIAPVDHEEILSQTPLEFSWEMSLDDDAITYEIEIAGSGLDTLITDIESMEITIPTSLFELNVPYTWSVSATDGYDKTKSAPFVFTMVNERPANFNLIMPLHEAVLLGPEMVAFSWESSQDTDPISYTLSVVGSGLDTVITNLSVTSIQIPASLFEFDTHYSWSVTASDSHQNTGSSVFTFQVSHLILGTERPLADQFKMYPNPFTALVAIQNGSEHMIDKIVVNNLLGMQQMAIDVMLPPNGEVCLESLKELPNGVYFVSLISGERSIYLVKVLKY